MRQGLLVVGVLGIIACGPPTRVTGGGPDASGGGHDAPQSHIDAPITPLVDAPPDAPAKLLVYAHTATALFSVDPDTYAITSVGAFQWPSPITMDQMTDIAIDKDGLMIGISFTNVYQVDPANAKATLLSNALGGTFNGLSFVPASMVGEVGDDVLIGTRNSDGLVFRINKTNGVATQIGNMGAYASSGDAVAVSGLGTLQTVTGPTSDVLVKLAPGTFAATPVGTGIGFTTLWGIAHGSTKIFGFSSTGQFILIDPTTGVGTLQSMSANQWWGAAVSTSAQIVIQ